MLQYSSKVDTQVFINLNKPTKITQPNNLFNKIDPSIYIYLSIPTLMDLHVFSRW